MKIGWTSWRAKGDSGRGGCAQIRVHRREHGYLHLCDRAVSVLPVGDLGGEE